MGVDRSAAATIETRGLSKIFRQPPWPLSLAARGVRRRVAAVQDVTMAVARGEICGVLGPNGAGKSTLLRLLATLLLPSAGRAWVAGADVVRESAAVRSRVGLSTGEERAFYWRLTGQENLEFFAGLRGLSPRTARQRAAATLARVDLASQAEQPVARYSTGMRQRLGVARALLGDPQVLLLDEPTRSLDPDAAAGMQRMIIDLAEEGRTILLATHDLTEAERICHRAAILAAGRLKALAPMEEFRQGGLAQIYREHVGTHEEPALSSVRVS